MAGPLVVITGASSGIGLALAHAFAKEGNALLLIARHMAMPTGLPAERTICAEADVADYAALEKAIRTAESKFGKTACLVNNAGLADAREFKAVEPTAYAHEIDVNLKGVLNGTKAVLADMSARGAGTIINISSVSDRKTSPVAVTYTATKYSVRAFSESLCEAEGKNGVRVINIAPGYVRTNIHAGMGISFDEYKRVLGNPDFLSAEELADIVLYCWKLPAHICVRDIVQAENKGISKALGNKLGDKTLERRALYVLPGPACGCPVKPATPERPNGMDRRHARNAVSSPPCPRTPPRLRAVTWLTASIGS